MTIPRIAVFPKTIEFHKKTKKV